MKKAISITQGYSVDSSLLTETEWARLEDELNNREVSPEQLAQKLGLTDQELESQLTHTETVLFDC